MHYIENVQNRMLRTVFVSKRKGVTDDWRKLHDEKLYNLYCLESFTTMIKSSRMRCNGHVARIHEICAKSWLGSLKEREHSQNIDINRMLILKYIL
jgi:hypothetical protein